VRFWAEALDVGPGEALEVHQRLLQRDLRTPTSKRYETYASPTAQVLDRSREHRLRVKRRSTGGGRSPQHYRVVDPGLLRWACLSPAARVGQRRRRGSVESESPSLPSAGLARRRQLGTPRYCALPGAAPRGLPGSGSTGPGSGTSGCAGSAEPAHGGQGSKTSRGRGGSQASRHSRILSSVASMPPISARARCMASFSMRRCGPDARRHPCASIP